MGTRGFLGFVADGVEKIAYNHSDSYPAGLGVDTLSWLRDVVAAESGVETARESVRALRVVSQEVPPTPKDVEQLAPWTNLRVSEGSTDEWYCLLRETQGNPAAILQAGVIEGAAELRGSGEVPYGYLVDFDAEIFEVYRRTDIVASWPLKDLPSDEVFVETFG